MNREPGDRRGNPRMPFRNAAPALLPIALLLLAGCGGGSSSTSPRSSDAEISSSSSVSSSSSEWPSLTLAPSYAPLAASANPAYAVNLYALWKGFHFTTLEADAAVYPTIAEEFGEVFGAKYLPAGRVVWAAQNTGYYNNSCSVNDATTASRKRTACTVSDGIGYGMLLALFNGDDDAFLRLWNYSRAFRDYANVGLTPRIARSFHWTEVENSSSTGADLDIAAALILMYHRTGNAPYLQDALRIASAIWDEEVDKSSHLLVPGNGEWGVAEPIRSLGRFSPVALRLFAETDPSHDWTAVLNAMYAYLQRVQSRGTGVLPNWSDGNGDAAEPPDGSDLNGREAHYLFGREASFAAWRLAWDWHWFQDRRAADALNALNLFISGKADGDPHSQALATLYTWNATAGADNTTATAVQHHLYGAWCATGVAGNMSWLDACTTGLNAKSPQNTTSSYFADVALALYSALLNGLFVMP